MYKIFDIFRVYLFEVRLHMDSLPLCIELIGLYHKCQSYPKECIKFSFVSRQKKKKVDSNTSGKSTTHVYVTSVFASWCAHTAQHKLTACVCALSGRVVHFDVIAVAAHGRRRTTRESLNKDWLRPWRGSRDPLPLGRASD